MQKPGFASQWKRRAWTVDRLEDSLQVRCCTAIKVPESFGDVMQAVDCVNRAIILCGTQREIASQTVEYRKRRR
jgi:hypothetical protein